MPRAIDVHAPANPRSEAGAAGRGDWHAIALETAVRLGSLFFIHAATLRMAAHVPRFHPHPIAASLPVSGLA